MSVREFAARLGVNGRMVSKWEAGGEKIIPRPVNQAALDSFLGSSSPDVHNRFVSLIGAAGAAEAARPIKHELSEKLPSAAASTSRYTARPGIVPINGTLESFGSLLPSVQDAVTGSQWPAWFGIKLAHLMALVDNWQGPSAQVDSLQDILHQEILMFDTANAESGESDLAAYAFSRRQALVTLAALPLAFATATTLPGAARSPAAATEFFLSRCAASLTGCWHLLRGSDLSTVEQMISGYLLPLEGIARQSSKYQETAAALASQAHRIYGIVALHRDQLPARERHCRQALSYATIAADVSSQASALISLASTYFYNSDPAQAARVYEEASALAHGMPTLQRSRVHAELSVVYGQLRREQDSARAAGLAEQLYPDKPEQDPSYLYAEFTPASLVLEKGLAYVALAEHFPGREYEQRASEIFARAETAIPSAVPDRIRFEIINQQARVAVLHDDMDAFELYLIRAIDGAIQLQSKQRYREMEEAYRTAMTKWPREPRIASLSERLQITAGDNDAETY